MQNIKVPGVLWVIGIVLAVVVGRTLVGQLGLNPIYMDVLVVAAIAVLKALNLGTKEIEELLNIIKNLQIELERRGGTPMAAPLSMALPRPHSVNPLMRWLVG